MLFIKKSATKIKEYSNYNISLVILSKINSHLLVQNH